DPPRGYLALARVAAAEKEDSKIEGLYTKAVEAGPSHYGARVQLAAYYLDERHANHALAEKQAQAALELEPDRISAYRVLALVYGAAKRFDDLSKLLARAEAAVPDDLSPYVAAGRALMRHADALPKAESYLRKYLAATSEPEAGAPHIAGVHWSLGLVHEKQG